MQVPFGVRAHDYGKTTTAGLGALVAKTGAAHIQLAFGKSFAKEDHFDPEAVTTEAAQGLATSLGASRVQVAVLGCYINLHHPDAVVRAKDLARFRNCLDVAPAMGSPYVGTETGSVLANQGPSPDNESEAAFQGVVGVLADLLDHADQAGARIAIEAVRHHIISTPARMKRVLDSLKTDNLWVILDPVNLIGADNLNRRYEVLREALDLFADRVRILHIKDFSGDNGQSPIVAPGSGKMDWARAFDIMAEYGIRVPVIIENCQPEDLPAAMNYLNKVGLSRVAETYTPL